MHNFLVQKAYPFTVGGGRGGGKGQTQEAIKYDTRSRPMHASCCCETVRYYFPLKSGSSRPSFEYISLYPKLLCVELVKIDQSGSGEEDEKL